MRIHLSPIWLLAAILVVSGCCSEEGKRRAGALSPEERAAAAAAAAAQVSAGEQASAQSAVAGMELAITPVAGFTVAANVERLTCENGKGRSARVKVTWASELPATASVRILTIAPDGTSKIWVEGGAVGEETTGPWVEDGARLELVDAQTKEALAQIAARSADCGR